MKLIRPVTIADANLTSTTVPETPPAAYNAGTTYGLGNRVSTGTAPAVLTVYESLQSGNTGHTPSSSPTWWKEVATTYAAWNSGTTYALGDLCIKAHRIYESLQAANTNKDPETETTWWIDTGPSNAWALFDTKIGTVTSVASPLTVVLRPGFIGGLCLMELVGESVSVTMKDGPGGSTVYSATVDLDGSIVTSFYDWFFGDFVQRTDLVLTDLPEHYSDPEITISITGSGAVACGVCLVGRVLDLGGTLMGPSIGITDYSRKETDDWGNYQVVERAFAKRGTFKVLIEKAIFNKAFRTLAAVRATPTLFAATDTAGYEPLIIFGFYKNFDIDVAYPNHYYCNLEIEGLI